MKNALRFVNRIRFKLGLKPLKKLKKGIPDNSGECPIANSIKCYRNKEVRICKDYYEYTFKGKTVVKALPKSVIDFVSDFDSGEYLFLRSDI